MDPRVTTPADGLNRQWELETQVAAAIARDYEAVQAVRSVRAQLGAIAPRAQALSAEIAALEQKLAGLEGGGGAGPRRASGGATLAQLNGSLRTIFEAADSADAAPTTQLVATFAEMQKSLDSQLQQWDASKADIESLNQKLRQANLPPIHLDASSK
jgi:hypothetical protein